VIRVLIIEDDPTLRETLVYALESRGYKVVQAANGSEGMDVFRSEPTDIVVTDIVMPEKDGTSTVAELRRDFPALGIIAISGARASSSLYLKVAKHLGANRTLEKPFALPALFDLIEEVLLETGVRKGPE
jgi:DNA-binding response OmpR family regulator